MRSLEDHLSPHELASLPASPGALKVGAPGLRSDERLIAQHLGQCEECSMLAQTYWDLRTLEERDGSAFKREDCPAEEVWLELAAGLRPEQRDNLAAHAVGCEVCAANLKRAIDLMQTEQSNDAFESVEGLASTTEVWQRLVASQMAATARPQPAPRSFAIVSRRLPRWTAYPLAAVLLLCAVLGSFNVWRIVHPSERELLARAYNKQRTMSLRIPGAEPVPIATGTLSAGDGQVHGLSDPTELTELKLRAQKHLDDASNSAYWHQILGEVQLQQLDGFGAKRNFLIAQASDQNLPNLQMDLAAAFFLIGGAPGNAGAYRDAADLYNRRLSSKEVQGHPEEAALIHYNLAQCWERLSKNPDEAIEELRIALSLERSDAWRDAIKDEISRLSSGSARTLTDGFETSLSDAIANLLPMWSDSPEAREKIIATARLGLSHKDRWLSDWVQARHTPSSAEADRHLVVAISAGKAGDGAKSLAESRQADAAYLKEKNSPGSLEAEAVETFALQRLGQSKPCVESGERILKDADSARYMRLRATAIVEIGSCIARQGDFTTARAFFEQASSLSAAASLPASQSLALTALAEALEYSGLASAAWQVDVLVLDNCATSPCTPARLYATLYNMVNCADQLREPYVAAEIMHSAEQFARSSGVPATDAYAIERLALSEAAVNNFAASAQDFRDAFNIERTQISGNSTSLTIALWQTDQAEVLLRQTDTKGAVDLLQKSGPVLLASDYLPGRVNYFSQLASVQISMGQVDSALENAELAVREAERSLLPLRSDSERNQWTRRNADVYAGLALAHLKQGDDQAALRVWEHFRAAPYARSDTGHLATASFAAPSGPPVLIIARLKDMYHGWLVKRDTDVVIKSADLGSRDEFDRLADTFYHLCADKDSSVSDIRNTGAYLYNALMKPFDHALKGGDRLSVDLDPTLSMLPLSAIPMPDGSWLGESLQLSVMPPWWSLKRNSDAGEIRVKPEDHLTVVNGFSLPSVQSSEIDELVNQFAHHRIIDAGTSAPDTLLRAIESSEIFHFTGHAGSDAVPQLLVTPGNAQSPLNLTAETIRSIHFKACRIAVLAACNTTSADPDQIEKLPDLRTAFLVAGARSVLASNWDVDDRSTHALMVAFYQRLSSGDSPAIALKAAQQSVRSRANWRHPFYWAPFEVFTN